MMGGRCEGGAFVYHTWENQMHGICRDCMLRDEIEEWDGSSVWKCQVVEGQEPSIQCPELQEHVRYNDIQLYGVNKP